MTITINPHIIPACAITDSRSHSLSYNLKDTTAAEVAGDKTLASARRDYFRLRALREMEERRKAVADAGLKA